MVRKIFHAFGFVFLISGKGCRSCRARQSSTLPKREGKGPYIFHLCCLDFPHFIKIHVSFPGWASAGASGHAGAEDPGREGGADVDTSL
jgi:hypothetical protein